MELLEQLKINALALRKMADRVLADVEAVERTAQRQTPKKNREIERKAAMIDRLLSGQRKPNKKH